MRLDQAAGPGSWVMGITAVVCLLLSLMSLWRGERVFPWYEWAFLLDAAIVFGFYLWMRDRHWSLQARNGPAISASLAAAVSVLGIRPDRDQGMGAAA